VNRGKWKGWSDDPESGILEGERKREKSFEYPISPERGRGRAEPGGGGIPGKYLENCMLKMVQNDDLF
jgi:hypothetical protein